MQCNKPCYIHHPECFIQAPRVVAAEELRHFEGSEEVSHEIKYETHKVLLSKEHSHAHSDGGGTVFSGGPKAARSPNRCP